MLKIFKNFSLSLIFFVVFYAVGYTTAPTLQIEEGWRWRNDLDIYLITGTAGASGAGGGAIPGGTTVVPAVPTYGPVPVQQIHKELALYEAILTHKLNEAYANSNIVIASLTLIVQMSDGREQRLYRIGDWLKHPIRMETRYFFPSEAATTLSNDDSESWAKPLLPDNSTLKTHLENFTSGPLGLERTFGAVALRRFALPVMLSERGGNFSHDFQHAEQKLIQYLWDFSARDRLYANSIIRREIIRILGSIGLGEGDINRIKLIILHIHSRLDLCFRCRLALSLFALKVQNGLHTELPHENRKFIVTVSSRSTYDNSRLSAGHDSFYNRRILVDVGNLADLPILRPPLSASHPLQAVRLKGIPVTPAVTAPALIIRNFHTSFPDEPFLQAYKERLPGQIIN